MKSVLYIALFFLSSSLLGQDDENWMMMNESKGVKVENGDTSTRKLYFGETKTCHTSISVDQRVNGLIKYVAEPGPDNEKIWGYRVQIFFDKSKENTNKEKAKFKTRYGHEVGCYVQYKAPNYRIKVGDFRTEIDAENFKQKLLGIFPTAFVVKEKIRLPRLKLEEKGIEDED